MWIATLTLKHDCILGNRCEKFGIILQSYDLNEEKKEGKVHTSSLHQIIGDQNNIQAFLKDLKKDKRTEYMESNERTLFLIETSKNKPVSHFTKRMFFVKPVIIDIHGVEHWEIASHNKEELIKFITGVQPLCTSFELKSIRNTRLKDVYFPKVFPKLTDLQKKALEFAVRQGYYTAPKKTNLRALARMMKISLATYQRHLQVAESKIMPDILSYIK